MTIAPYITKENFVEILQNNKLVQPEDLLIFKTIYSLEKQKASATDLARLIGWIDKGATLPLISLKEIKLKNFKKWNFQNFTKPSIQY